MAASAKADEVVDVEVDYSTVSTWTHGWISDGAASRIEFEDGCIHFKSDEATAYYYDVQFQPFPGVPSLDYDASYTITIKIKGSVTQNIRGYFSGSDLPGDIPVTTDWQTLTFENCQNNPEAQYFANTGSVLMQCGDYVGEWWISYVKISHEENDNSNKPKCAKPTITYNNGVINFSCATEDVKYISEIIAPAITKKYDNEISLSSTYTVTVYATKVGYINSDKASIEIQANSGIKGDMNDDGKVDVADHVELSKIIMNSK